MSGSQSIIVADVVEETMNSIKSDIGVNRQFDIANYLEIIIAKIVATSAFGKRFIFHTKLKFQLYNFLYLDTQRMIRNLRICFHASEDLPEILIRFQSQILFQYFLPLVIEIIQNASQRSVKCKLLSEAFMKSI